MKSKLTIIEITDYSGIDGINNELYEKVKEIING